MGAVLDAVWSAVTAGAPAPVSMPIADVLDAEVPLGSIDAFGLSGGVGHRRFRTGLEITAGANPIEVRAMFRGLLSDFGMGCSVDFPDRGAQGLSADRLEAGAWYYAPRSPALALRVSALAPLHAALASRPATSLDTGYRAWRHPIELPAPAWVIYEGVGLQVSPEVSVTRRETFDRIPVDFPADGQSWGDWGGGVPTAEVAELLDGYEERLQDLVALLLGDDTHTLRAYVIGHTDSTANEQHNDALSERRARMFGAKMQELAQAFAGVQLEEYQLNLTWKGERRLRYRSDADHPDQRALNRRIEVVVTSGEDLEVAAGQVIGSATGTLRVTVLDETGRFLDPLDVVRRYDQDGLFAQHVLSGHRDPRAPAIASGWVHCITPPGTTGDGVDDPRDAQYFASHPLDPSDENPVASVLEGSQLGGVQPADVVWLADLETVHATLELETPITLVGTQTGGLRVPVVPTTPTSPIVTIDEPEPSGIGFRLLGLIMMSGRALTGGAAIRMEGPDEAAPAELERRVRSGEPPVPPQNIHVADCEFVNNHPTLGQDGGAIYVEQCVNVLIEDCRFSNNRAGEGGALFATLCTNVVVGGRPLDPAVEATFATLVSDPNSTTNPPPTALEPVPYDSRLTQNEASGSGGALAFDRSTFEVGGCFFAENVANDGMGGAVVAYLDEAEVLAAKSAIDQAGPGSMPRARSRITHCVARQNLAGTEGGAFAIVGTRQSTPEVSLDLWSGGGACHVLESIVSFNIALKGRGGGLLLAAGAVVCVRNRIDGNQAHGAGGGVACIGQAHARLSENLIFRNRVQPISGPWPSDDPGGIVGMHGGGGLYARGFSSDDRTTVWLAGQNWLLGNESAADGGGALAVSGVRLVCGWGQLDVFDSNRAAWSGGGVAARNADLEIYAGEQFMTNQAMRGYGGGVFFGGTTMYGAPQSGLILRTDAAAGVVTDLPSARGARLTIQGTAGAPVHFGSNQATHGDIDGREVGGVGAALFIVQQPAPPLPDSPLVPAMTERLVRRSIGLVRHVSVQGIRCAANLSNDSLGRSVTIVVQGLEHRWIPEYDLYPRLEGARDSWIGRRPDGGYDLGPYEIHDLTFESESGDGIWFIQSINKVEYSGIAPDRLVDLSPPVLLHP